jgi:tight adherence protein C
MAPAAEHVQVGVSIAAFVATLLLCAGVILYWRDYAARRRLVKRVKGSAEEWEQAEPGGAGTLAPAAEENPLLRVMSRIGRSVSPRKSQEYSAMKLKFLRAGIRRPNAQAVFWGFKCVLALLLPLGFLSLRVAAIKLMPAGLTMAACVILALVGFYLPDAWLEARIRKRKETIRRGLPDALDLLVVCVEAGMGLDAAMNRVAEEIVLTNKTLSDELKLFNLEIRAGKQRQDAMKNMAARIDLEDVTSLATLLIQTDKFGTSLAQTLRVYSDTFRTKRFIKAEEIAAKLPVKLMFPMILFIFPALFVVILGPSVVRLLQFLSSR